MPQAAASPLLARVSPDLSVELRGYLGRHRAEVEAMIRIGGPDAGLCASSRYARVCDGLLTSLFQAVHAAMQGEGSWRPLSLAAVGSYGRGAVSFNSDLDVRLLAEQDVEGARYAAEALLYPLWDIGLTIGHQVVTEDELLELARRDLPTATALLDWRVLGGGEESSRRLLSRAYDGLFSGGNIGEFLERLAARAAERHDRYGGSVYLLEPDVKNGPGGIRDLDVAHWAGRSRWRLRDLSDLVKIGVLVPREWEPVRAATEQLWRIRNLLHVHAGRRSDRLSFDRQEQLAEILGYGSGGHSVERFMSDYYRHARVIERARSMILSRALPPPTRRPHVTSIGRGLHIVGGAVSLAHPAALDGDPALALRLYAEAIRRDLPVYEFAKDSVMRATSRPEFCERLRSEPEAAKLFVKLLATAQRTRFKNGSVLGELHDAGLLVAMIPEFSPVVGRVHHDIYHVFTVDAHSIAAVDRLRALVRGELATEYPLASRLAAEISRPKALYLATLLHDVGKDIGGKNHSERGAEMAAEILARFGISEPDIRAVRELVSKHLRMYHVATRRDLDDPGTLETFGSEVGGREGLKNLYLLTVADVSTTSPTALTSWKARMLDELYLATDRWLDRGPRAGADLVSESRRLVEKIWNGEGGRGFLAQFLDAVPERYLYANEPEEVVRHARFALESDARSAAVKLIGADGAHAELAFIADDRPGLLAIFTATLAAARLEVIAAEVMTWRDAQERMRALDLFWVRSSGDVDQIGERLPRIQRDLERLLSAELAPRELVLERAGARRFGDRHLPAVATEVHFDQRSSATHTVIEVIGRDRPGLLFWLANTLQEAGLVIHLAKINTEGMAVADVFYVTDASGAKLTHPERVEEVRSRIHSTLAEISA
jgi:[protein-PII] uridylyltransferase